MGFAKLAFKIFMTVYSMLMVGEKISSIKSACFVQYADYLFERKMFASAIRYYTSAISLKSGTCYIYSKLAETYLVTKQLRHAADACDKAIAIKPYISLYFLQNIIHKALGETVSYGESFKKALAYYNNKLDLAYGELSAKCHSLGLYDFAELYQKEAIKNNPNEAGVHYNLALIYVKLHQYQLATAEFQKVLQLSSADFKKLKTFRERAKTNIEAIKKMERVPDR